MNELVSVSQPIDKNSLRAEARERRKAADRDIGFYAGNLLAEQFFRDFPYAGRDIISAYWPIQDEIDPLPLMQRLCEHSHPVCLPVVHSTDMPLTFREWRPGAEMISSAYDTQAPSGSARALIPDIVLLPLLGFDRLGNRLGYGQGYYDRTLDHLRAEKPIIAVGLAYAAQEFSMIPADEHDQQLDWVITEDGVIKIN